MAPRFNDLPACFDMFVRRQKDMHAIDIGIEHVLKRGKYPRNAILRRSRLSSRWQLIANTNELDVRIPEKRFRMRLANVSGAEQPHSPSPRFHGFIFLFSLSRRRSHDERHTAFLKQAICIR
jgi:hypothetical protein